MCEPFLKNYEDFLDNDGRPSYHMWALQLQIPVQLHRLDTNEVLMKTDQIALTESCHLEKITQKSSATVQF
jgi:hypothetical protein